MITNREHWIGPWTCMHTVGIYAWQFSHVVRTFNLTLRLGNAVIIFKQIAINMTDRHTKSIQILLHVTTSYASKQPKQPNNSQPSLTFLFRIDLEISGKFRKCSGPPLEALPEKARGSRCFILLPSSLLSLRGSNESGSHWWYYRNWRMMYLS